MNPYATVSAPRSATELLPEVLHLSPKQKEVLDCLKGFSQGAKIPQIADELDMHPNTVRGHLNELSKQGAVRSVTSLADGRGRPGLIFQARIPDNRTVAQDYIALIQSMTTAFVDSAELGDFESVTARAIGRSWAQATPGNVLPHTTERNADASMEPLMIRLRDMGFDPSLALGDACQHTVELHSCPFVAAGEEPSAFVCAIHAGYLESMNPNPHTNLRLAPKSGNGKCAVHVETAHSESSENV